MNRKMNKLMVSKIPNRNQTMPIPHGRQKMGKALSAAVRQWVGIMGICLCVWAVLSPIFYEQFYMHVARANSLINVLFIPASVLFFLLLFVVASTREVIVETRKQYFPPAHTNNAALPLRRTLVRASSEPMQAQKAVLLRAAEEGQEKHEEQLVRAFLGEQEQP